MSDAGEGGKAVWSLTEPCHVRGRRLGAGNRHAVGFRALAPVQDVSGLGWVIRRAWLGLRADGGELAPCCADHVESPKARKEVLASGRRLPS